MANFKQMSTKKLNTLLNSENTSAEDKAAIQEVLNTRNAASASAEAPVIGTDTPAESTDAPAESTQAPAKKVKMTDEERDALAEKLRAEVVNHRCEVVPFNSLEWVPGIIAAIIVEKRMNKVMIAVKTDDGRRIVKTHDSQLIKVLDEVIEPVKKARSNKKTQLDADGNPIPGQTTIEWSDEAIEEAVKEVINNVGKTISFPEAGKYGEVAEDAPIVTGRIISLVPNKRQQTILYRIELDQVGEDGVKKYAHKVTTNDALVIADTFDEAGEEINKKFVERRYKEAVPKVEMTPEEALMAAEASLKKAVDAQAKANALVEKRQSVYEAAKAAYEAWVNDPAYEAAKAAAEETDSSVGDSLM